MQETALGAALKAAVQTMSKKKQTELIANYIYGKYEVFSRFKPLAIGIDKDLLSVLPQYDPVLVARVLANHCRRPRYIKALACGGKRFDLHGHFKGAVTAEEQAIAKAHPCMQSPVSSEEHPVQDLQANETEFIQESVQNSAVSESDQEA